MDGSQEEQLPPSINDRERLSYATPTSVAHDVFDEIATRSSAAINQAFSRAGVSPLRSLVLEWGRGRGKGRSQCGSPAWESGRRRGCEGELIAKRGRSGVEETPSMEGEGAEEREPRRRGAMGGEREREGGSSSEGEGVLVLALEVEREMKAS